MNKQTNTAPMGDVSYELIQDDQLVACTSGSNALREIQHYAAQYEQDGPVEIIKCVRTPAIPSPVDQDIPSTTLQDAKAAPVGHFTLFNGSYQQVDPDCWPNGSPTSVPLYTRPAAHSSNAAPSDIPTWQERMVGTVSAGMMMQMQIQQRAMMAEIADLRAALAARSPVWTQEMIDESRVEAAALGEKLQRKPIVDLSPVASASSIGDDAEFQRLLAAYATAFAAADSLTAMVDSRAALAAYIDARPPVAAPDAEAIRSAALEDAAKLADAADKSTHPADIAAAIRALSQPSPAVKSAEPTGGAA